MNKGIRGLLLALGIAYSLTGLAAPKHLFGYLEKINILPKNLNLEAKLDTGAKTASIYAIDIQKFEKNGQQWVHFKVPSASGPVKFTKKIHSYSKIKVRQGEKTTGKFSKDYIARPVVLMRIQMGKQEHIVAVNLADRKNFLYPVLLGRDAIKKFDGAIDPSKSFTLSK